MDKYESLYDTGEYTELEILSGNILKDNSNIPLEERMIRRVNQYKFWEIEDIYYVNQHSYGWRNPEQRDDRDPMYEIFYAYDNEFLRYHIIPQKIVIEYDGRITESLKLPVIDFIEVANEDWETSKIRSYLLENKFFFVVYKPDNRGHMRLMGCQFWQMPPEDVEEYVRPVWQRTHDVILSGDIWYVNRRGVRQYNFTSKKENLVCHVRNGAMSNKDVAELPDGTLCQKRRFALDNDYLETQMRSRYMREVFFIKSDGTRTLVQVAQNLLRKRKRRWEK